MFEELLKSAGISCWYSFATWEVLALCSTETEELSADFQLGRGLKPLIELKTVQEKNISNPYLFRGASMVTTFVCLAGNRSKGMWKCLDKASRADIRLVELEHPSVKLCLIVWAGCRFIFTHFYKSLELQFLLDVSGLSRDGRVTTELGTSSLRHAVGILIPDDFRSIVDSE